MAARGHELPHVTPEEAEAHYLAHAEEYESGLAQAADEQAAWRDIRMMIARDLSRQRRLAYQDARAAMLQQLLAQADVDLLVLPGRAP